MESGPGQEVGCEISCRAAFLHLTSPARLPLHPRTHPAPCLGSHKSHNYLAVLWLPGFYGIPVSRKFTFLLFTGLCQFNYYQTEDPRGRRRKFPSRKKTAFFAVKASLGGESSCYQKPQTQAGSSVWSPCSRPDSYTQRPELLEVMICLSELTIETVICLSCFPSKYLKLVWT